MMERVRQIDELLRCERFERAGEAVEALLADATLDLDGDERWCLRLRRAERLLHGGEQPVDEAIFALEDLLASPRDGAVELPRAHAGLVRAYTVKRCQELAAAAVETARAAVGEAPVVLLAEGDCALEFDDRTTARARYQQALERSDPASAAGARLALANLLYVLGDFNACHELLDPMCREATGWAGGVRLRASALAAVHDYAGEAAQWRRVVEALPDGDNSCRDQISLGLALASAGDHPAALEALLAAWRADPDSPQGLYARERIEHLEQAPPGTARRRLQAFPTTQQKWNYCGPAVLELCLRFLHIDLGQDEIAAAVKRSAGTPMYEIDQYLRDRDVVARRIEATPARLKAAIDLGLPVIVQEEYSTTSHVAVITGYDEALGLFIASDPMTHRQMVRSFAWTERAGAMFGNGGLVVLGRRGPALDGLLRRADEAGLVEARHLTILDECDRRRPRPGGAGADEDTALQRVVRLCEEALRLSPGFKLAWYRLWHAENQLYHLSGRPEARDQVLAHLHHVRTTFSEDEWPHQLHGQWLMDAGRFEESFVAYFEASRRDLLDANNLQAMGECKWLAGDLAAAERYMLEALGAEPFHVRAAENLAGVYLRQLELGEGEDDEGEDDEEEADEGEDDEEEADEGEDDEEEAVEQPGGGMVPREVLETIDRPAAEVARRAAHFSRVACSRAPENPFNHEIAAALHCRAGRLEQGIAAYRRARQMVAERPFALFGLAGALERAGQHEEAGRLLAEGTERFWRDPAAWRARAAFLVRRAAPEAAAGVLARGIETLTAGQAGLAAPYFEILRELEPVEAAAARLRQLAEQRPGNEDLLREVAYLLDESGQRGHAVALLRHVVARSPHDVNAVYRLGNLLSEDLLTRPEGRALLERVVELAPDASAPRRQLAWHFLSEDPERGLALLEPVLDQEDPFVHETRAVLLEALERQPEADRAFRTALDAQGAAGPGLLELCAWHLEAQRYERALHLAHRLAEHELPEELQQTASYYWIRAHRMAGAVREALPRIRELCAEELAEDLAWEVYWACRSLDHELAARAAEVCARTAEEEASRLEWSIHAAAEREHLGEEGALDPLRELAGESAESWANLSWAYADLKRFDEANAAAARAHELDPDDRSALTAMGETHVRLNRPDEALACAHKLARLYPHEHQGPERLGILLAKRLEVEPALRASEQAVDAAPYCHISHRSRALALLVAGQHELAARHARQALDLEPPDEEDAADDALMVLRALEGDASGLRRCLDTLALSEPPEIFAEFKARLLALARGSRATIL